MSLSPTPKPRGALGSMGDIKTWVTLILIIGFFGAYAAVVLMDSTYQVEWLVVAAVPVVIVLHPAVRAVPVTAIVHGAVMTWPYPCRTFIRRPAPIPRMPSVAAALGIPVAVYKSVTRPRTHRLYSNDPWPRRRSDSDSDADLRE